MTLRHLSSDRLVLALATLVLATGLVASAWVATSASTTDHPQVDADVSERYDSLQGIEATRTTTIERNGTQATSRTYSVQLRPGTGERRLSLANGSASRYDRRVSNGSVLWLYDRDAANATRISLGGPAADAAQGDRIERLFTRLNATDAAGETPAEPPTVEPLPVVPEANSGQPPATAGAGPGAYEVTYAGTETVADRDVHVVRITSPNGTGAANYEQTLWIDTEHFYPLKQRTAWTDDGERTVLTTTYEDVQFDPGLDDDVFTPDFPANTTVHAPDTPETTTYESVGALEAATNVSVPEPAVPPSYELTYATRTEGRVEGVGLRYANSTSRLTVAKYDFTYPADDGDEQVTVDGRQGQLTYGPTVTLSWNCESYRYTVRGEGVSTDLVQDIGQSVGCPGAGT